MLEVGHVTIDAIGYCPLFSKNTEATHGRKCTAFELRSPNIPAKPLREEGEQ